MKFKSFSQYPLLNLALSSFLILFIELLVIRLVSTEIRIFAYLSNLVLLATFIGSGLGMLIKKKLSLSLTALGLFILSLVLKVQFIFRLPRLEIKLFSGITELLAPLSESYVWLQTNTFSKTGIIIGIFLTVCLFFLITLIFMPLGQYLGEILNRHRRPLLAYSVNILFSLIGMWAFNCLSILGLSPYLGLVLAQFLLLLLIKEFAVRQTALIALIATTILLTPQSAYKPEEKPVTFWSPYQKLTLSKLEFKEPQKPEGWYLEVNNVGYMGLFDFSPYAINNRQAFIEGEFRNRLDEIPFSNQYDLPYKFLPQAQKVLIVGGGAGNDAAAAVREAVQSIEVVEIDPKIIALGKKYHVENPYSKPNVSIHINDGRAFFATTKDSYDLIIMSLADSHAVSSSLTNLQLDNYLYTEEALTKVKSLLKPNGLLLLSFEVTRPWIGQRLQQTLTLAFGYKPKIFEVRSKEIFGWGGIVFVIGKNPGTVDRILTQNQLLAKFVAKYAKDYSTSKINPLSDNWPYIYLDRPRLPTLHLIVAAIIISSLLLFKTKIIPRKTFDWQFFFLGAGFMLFEFQNISKSSLLFGNTWVTNLFIITGVLCFVLLANLAVARKLIPLRSGFILLITSLLVQFFIPLSWLNQLTGINKIVISLTLLNLPHFFSAIVFAQLFSQHKHKAVAFGSNLLGSAIGGLFEVFSFLWGINSLLYFTFVFYCLGAWKSLNKK